jgi:nucleoside-diphosphate-sugar epimerase
MKKTKLLITGSSGRIGSILMKGLADSFELYGVDTAAIPGEKIFKADLSNYEQIDAVIRFITPIPVVIHLAGEPRVNADWISVLKKNIIATRNIYETAKKHEVNRVVFASSNHATGAYEGFPPTLHLQEDPEIITVHHPLRPDSDYGTSKIFGEAVARQYYECYGISSICLRIGTVLAKDEPTSGERIRRTWLSHKDLIQLIKKSITADIGFGIYYGVSNNKGRFWDISNAVEELGYYPMDDASLF